MTARLLDGKALAARIRSTLQGRIAQLREAGKPPSLVAVQVGEHPASEIYLRNQRRRCEDNGVAYRLDSLPGDASLAQVVEHLDGLGGDPAVTGIIVQRPLPAQVPGQALQIAIPPMKDVEGTNPINLGMVMYGRPTLMTCTALAVQALIRESGIALRGAEAVVVGHSEIVGKPVALALLDALATTTVCHIATQDLAAHTQRADLLVVAVGKAGLITPAMVKPGAVVIDVGINRVGDKTVGDCEAGVAEVASAITPVPGGVGPVTVAMLLRNTVECARVQAGLPPFDDDDDAGAAGR
ncbi:MAG: bifunctional 5,10-methylenetetrahydrofolate dehydrogenase/5,10-methenyltetrahydrofolate cyclohydrolase [Planctomycetota bacterium]|jgi:methylenetetrahydrofolate dehydrogenase (NADP+)/methenyltetrahydrofolate cyclohydrolase